VTAGDEPFILHVAQAITFVIFVSAVLQNLLHLLQLVMAAAAIRERPPLAQADLLHSRYDRIAPAISVVAPCLQRGAHHPRQRPLDAGLALPGL
jgi:hypothetical protein